MKIGLSNLYLTTTSFKELIKNMENHGEECKIWELVDECKLSLQKRRIKILNGLKNSYSFTYIVHGPFCDLNIASMKPKVRNLSIRMVEKSISDAVMLGAKRFIMHPGFFDIFNLKETIDLNLISIGRIAEYAEKLSIPIAIENMPSGYSATLCNIADFKMFFGQVNLNKIGLALDFGHANMIGELESFMIEFKGKISHIHLHDNNSRFDSHLNIGDGTIDWVHAMKKIKDIRFRDYAIVESIMKPFESYMRILKIFIQNINQKQKIDTTRAKFTTA